NAQAQHGADIMSRVEFAVAGHGQQKLQELVRNQIGSLVEELIAAAPRSKTIPEGSVENELADKRVRAPVKKIILVGNTVMHHLFCGIDLDPLSHYPFEPITPGLQSFPTADLGWKLNGKAVVHFLPCLGGFVGSDILAGIVATGLHESESLNALI